MYFLYTVLQMIKLMLKVALRRRENFKHVTCSSLTAVAWGMVVYSMIDFNLGKNKMNKYELQEYESNTVEFEKFR